MRKLFPPRGKGRRALSEQDTAPSPRAHAHEPGPKPDQVGQGKPQADQALSRLAQQQQGAGSRSPVSSRAAGPIAAAEAPHGIFWFLKTKVWGPIAKFFARLWRRFR